MGPRGTVWFNLHSIRVSGQGYCLNQQCAQIYLRVYGLTCKLVDEGIEVKIDGVHSQTIKPFFSNHHGWLYSLDELEQLTP